MTYYFIATNYNNSYHTLRYIKNVYKLPIPDGCSKNIIIVDNQSTESLDDIELEVEKIKRLGIVITLIKNETNLGYFKGLNVGLGLINQTNKMMAIIGNNDLLFDDDFLININKIKLEKHDFSIVPDVYLPNGKKQNPHTLKRPTILSQKIVGLYFKNYYFGQLMKFINKILKKNSTCKIYSKPIYIHGGIGAIYILTPKFFRHHSELFAPVFLYGEEVLFSHQIHNSGGKILYHPELRVLHNEHSTVSKEGGKRIHKLGKDSYKIYKKYY